MNDRPDKGELVGPDHTPDVSRRDFVKYAAAGTLIPALTSCATTRSDQANRVVGLTPRTDAASVEAAPIVNDAPLRVGLIGCGGRGTGAALQALNADNNITLVAMGDVFPDRIQSSLSGLTQALEAKAADKIKVSAENQFTGFDAYRKVIDSDVDVVILATPPGFRPMHLKAAIEAGKHVFCEKPVAVDAPGVRSVLASAALAKQKNLAIVCGFCWRYGDAERATFKMVNAGAIGELVTVHSTYLASTLSKRQRQPEWSEMEFQLRNWWHFTWLSGDHLVEQACHSVDRLAWATGDRTPVRCVTLGGRAARNGPEHGHVFDHFAVTYEYENGMRCMLTTRQIDGCPSDNSDYIFGTQGSCEVNGWKPVHVIKDLKGSVAWTYTGQRRDMYQNEHDELFRSIRAATPINDGEWMAHSTMMAIMGRMAAYTGQTISWEQAMKSREDLSPPTYELGDLPTPVVAVPGQTKFV
jgi:myo-inositol 2-dehydrogenase / D-chiro-inositol 1-dehydrogenase